MTHLQQRHLLDMWRIRTIATLLTVVAALCLAQAAQPRADAAYRIVVIGDSLSAGYGLPGPDAFPAKLEVALKNRGHEVSVENAGVSGDTTAGGRARLAWAIGNDPDAVIVELGANDALRGLDPAKAYDNLSAMLDTLAQQKIPVLLAGMQSPPNMGEDYARDFNAIYSRLAESHDVILYPFFLEGVAGNPALNQDDGIHPTADGVDVIVKNIMPAIEELLKRAGTAKGRS
jgi:acyl-CoA thioesterase-1